MAVKNPEKVPKKNINSLDVPSMDGGLYLLGAQSARPNQFISAKNMMISPNGKGTQRYSLKKWLPDTIGVAYQRYPALVNGEIHYFTADDGKIRWCLESDADYTDCTGDNVITTGDGIMTTFLRVSDSLLIMNGVDKVAYVDLNDPDLPVVKFTHVDDPANAPTVTPTGLTNTGGFKVYYATSYSSTIGETELSPILSYTVNKPRTSWNPNGTSELLTIARNNTPPAEAKDWNVYIALAPAGSTIQPSDMMRLATGLDINQTSFIDNGLIPIDLSYGTAPEDNTTDGPIITHGIETMGRAILYGDVNARYNIWIGGYAEHALDFSPAHGGYRAEVNKGTDYYPTSVIGFRNGQGVPSLTILFSNTRGLSKQATLEQQTVNYGNMSFVVWAVTEQHYGAAGVASTYGVINYAGALSFPSTNGIMTMDTEPSVQNVISQKRITKDIGPYIKNISTKTLSRIVGAAWDNRLYWIIPASGTSKPTEILIRDLDNSGAWYTWDIPANWIDVVSPDDSPSFVYISEGNSTYKLEPMALSVDILPEVTPFPMEITGGLLGLNTVHNAYQAVVQAVFYLTHFAGTVTIGVNYRNENGRIKTKKKVVHGPAIGVNVSDGWSNVQYVYNGAPMPESWDSIAPLYESVFSGDESTVREPLQMNVLATELQYFVKAEAGYNSVQVESVSYEGENLGIKPDLR